ncbi:hypothetical protein TNCV_2658551 [Trichonephila clavipes]|nr:hypothetical protein TNCV_2658551 [Trichonephila clavipes]
MLRINVQTDCQNEENSRLLSPLSLDDVVHHAIKTPKKISGKVPYRFVTTALNRYPLTRCNLCAIAYKSFKNNRKTSENRAKLKLHRVEFEETSSPQFS